MSNPWMKFYPADWRSDAALRSCSIAARGLWMEMLCIAHECTPRGALAINGNPISSQTLASLAGLRLPETRKLMAELEAAGVFSMAADGTIYSRRMFRDEEKAARDRENGKGGGNPKLKAMGVNPPHNPTDKAKKLEARSQSYPSQEGETDRVEVVALAGNVIPMAREAL